MEFKRYGKSLFLSFGISGIRNSFPAKQLFLNDLRKFWKDLVGANIAFHSYPDQVKNNTLIVNVDDPIWIQELSLHKDEIRDKVIKRFDGKGYSKFIEQIKFHNGEVPREPIPEELPALEIDRSLIDEIDRQLEKVKEKKLQSALRHYLIESSLRSKKDDGQS